MSKISVNELAQVLVEKNGLGQKDAEQFVAAIFDVVKKGLERENLVKIKGLGTFKIIGVEARESVNVNTGERVVIESHGKITFTPEATMKELVNKPFSQFETVVLNDGIEFDDMKDDSDGSYAVQEQIVDSREELPQVQETASEGGGSMADEDEIASLAADEIQSGDNEETGSPNYPVEESVDMQDNTAVSDIEEEPGTEEDFAEKTEGGQETPVLSGSTEEKEKGVDLPEKQKSAAPLETENRTEPDVTESDSKDGTDKGNGTGKQWLLFCIILVILVAAAFGGGYFYAKKTVGADTEEATDIEDAAFQARLDSIKATVINQDTIGKKPDTAVGGSKKAEPTSKPEETAAQKQGSSKQSEPAKAAQTEKADDTVLDPSVYDKMDNRVRTGAYRIVGTDHIRTVKSGETLQGISRQILGEGMSCYIEVYNGLGRDAELKAGQKIKIPKLELKKRSRKK